jgi:hypothetical protein
VSVDLKLVCNLCGRSVEPYVPFRLSRLGGLRLHVATDWYVDGGDVACPKCRTEEQTQRIMSESHNDREIRHVAAELDIDVQWVQETTERWEVRA